MVHATTDGILVSASKSSDAESSSELPRSPVRKISMMARAVQAAALLAALCIAPVRADIGFAEAVAIARAQYPTRELIDIRARERRDGPVFTTESVNSFGTVTYPIEIDASTGEIDLGETEAVLPPEDLEMMDVLVRLPLRELDFTDALLRAHAFTGQTDADVERISLHSAFFMLTFDVRYADNTRVTVDAVTGTVFDDDANLGDLNAVDFAEFASLLKQARGATSPPYTALFDAQVLVTPSGTAMSAQFLNPANGRIRQVDLIGDTVQVSTFTAIGRLAERITEALPALPSVLVTPEEFLSEAANAFPGGRIGSVQFDARIRNGVQRTRWASLVLAADGALREFSLDATVPLGEGTPLVQAAMPRIPGDLDGDGQVGVTDLAEFLAASDADYPPHDLTHDGAVDGADLAVILSNWGG